MLSLSASPLHLDRAALSDILDSCQRTRTQRVGLGYRACSSTFRSFSGLDPMRFKERLSALDARLDALQGQDQALAHELPQARPPHRTRRPSKPSLTSSITSSPTASPSKPRPCSQSSLPSCESTAARKSYPPTASAHPWFARRQEKWSQPKSMRTTAHGFRAGGCRLTTLPSRLVPRSRPAYDLPSKRIF
jgi:hypothetical protein